MPDNAYATVDELKDFLGLQGEDRDYALDGVVTTASRLIDRWTGHQFYTSANQVRYFCAGSDPTYVAIDDLLSASALATDSDGDSTYETVWTPVTDFYFGPVNAPAHNEPYTRLYRTSYTGRFYFPAYTNSVKITGTWGYSATLPREIKHLCLIVSQVLCGPLLDMAMPGVSSYKLGTEISAVALQADNLPYEARVLLSLYGAQTYVVL